MLPSQTTSRPSGPSRKSFDLGRRLVLTDAEDRERCHDAADADRGDADREQQPELADHRHLREPQRREGEDRVEGHDEQRGAEVARGLLDRVVGAVDDDLFLDARVHLDRVVDADAEHHGQPADGDDRQRDAEVAGDAERPDHADQDDAEREQPPAHAEEEEEDQRHDRDRDRAEGQHPAGQVVVEVLQQAWARRS